MTNMDEKYSSIRFLLTVTVVAVFLLLFAAIFTYQNRKTVRTPSAHVAATIFPLYGLASFIGAEHASVQLILPEGEALSELAAAASRVSYDNVQAIFAIGHELDTAGIPEEARERIFTVDENVSLQTDGDGKTNPYYWLSVKEAPIIAENITRRLSSLDPEHESYYRGRLNLLRQQLAILDANIAELMLQIPAQQLAVYGYDWSYFVEDYGLDIVWYEPVVRDDVIATASLDTLAERMEKNGLSTIFSDVNLSPVPLLPAMLRTNAMLLNLDALGGIEGRVSYSTLMAFNARTIFDGAR
ncbi:MAG: hypothetical protein A3B31_01535 [Candidatus Komeilibacteria bacterium RIFCSPLOWO2_01_FULL_53_11]|uniref:Zinc ABC transporter substrate-binding protein n=1 Tax=Candidatus Komeilibacteria bacterium RIFCSPLOWO2_01_FULL_53_11 TaxID=1798552 RepID=A0A1G2BSQ8_9BACT|nr:MAG: hypothetical protein A3B31_01535 [Candidatus Komeilibacteria bacterium RIFCSPLOWO2_01_FULL_53_11]